MDDDVMSLPAGVLGVTNSSAVSVAGGASNSPSLTSARVQHIVIPWLIFFA